MKRRTALPELLAPAGSEEALRAAVSAGADAVYLGGKCFNARAYAQNFDDEALARSISYAHLFGVRVYVTLNTLVLDRELSSVIDYARRLYEMGADAVIVADLGLVSELKKHIPALEIHASTQATVHSSLSADEMYSLGVCRVVLSRELSLENIKSTTGVCAPETEIFLHGALCVSHSGQCLFSSLVGGRSGNRGECAQPCRLPYNNTYPLSLRDLCLAEHIPSLIDSGVASLKIEGRMKSPSYVYEVTRIYRTLLDERRPASREEMSRLAAVFCRDGFTDKYLTARTDEKMTGTRSERDKALSREVELEIPTPEKIKIQAKCKISEGEPARLTLSAKDKTVTVSGQTPSPALSSPLTPPSVKARLSKMGATPFSLDEASISLTLDSGLNLPPSAINSLRREATEALISELTRVERENQPPFSPKARATDGKKPKRTALCFFSHQYNAVRDLGFFDVIFLPLTELDGVDSVLGVYIPPVIFEGELDSVRALLRRAKDKGAKYALVGNVSHYTLAEEHSLTPIADFRMNIANKRSAALHSTLGALEFIASPELSLPQLRDLGGLAIVYGRIPLMLLERCFMRESFGCKNCNACALTDRKGVTFPMIREYQHRNLLLNSSITYMGDKKSTLAQYNIRGEHFIFSTESAKECLSAISAYKNGEELSVSIRRISK